MKWRLTARNKLNVTHEKEKRNIVGSDAENFEDQVLPGFIVYETTCCVISLSTVLLGKKKNK